MQNWHPFSPLRRTKTMLCGLALAASLPLPAHAFCGFYAGKADANLFNEASQVVLVRDGKRTVISMLNDYKGPLSEFALVVPTPTTLQKGQVRVADKATFERLDAYSSPRLAEYNDSDPCQVSFTWGMDAVAVNAPPPVPMMAMSPALAKSAEGRARDQALGVTVDVQYTLEEYDIVSLSATQSDGLETWLHENGYKIPKGASAALKPYINQGMKFFVAKVNLQEQLKTGYTTLRPLQFAFESDKFMLPMRLGMLNAAPDKPQDLIVYLLTKNGRVESSNYRTVKLPTDTNVPYFIKPKFQDFYKTMFARQASKEDNRVVFTEYFWDMAWCDPCAGNPLNPEELRGAGVFWLDGNPDDNFKAMTSPPGTATKRTATSNVAGGGQPAVLTRLHVRYTPRTFPEDLMFIQTKDRQNWQARYVIQTPFDGSVAQCSEKVAQMDCEAMCKTRVSEVLSLPKSALPDSGYRGKGRALLQRECLASCVASKRAGINSAALYYHINLPKRLATERQTLADLTGWSANEIDALPGASRYTGPWVSDASTATPAAEAKPSWWAAWFGTGRNP